MKKLIAPALACCFGALALSALAADVEVKAPWVRGTVAGQPATGAFMTLTSKGGASLVGASSPVAEVVEVHQMKMDNGVMKMRAARRVELPAGKPVELAPGGYHVMLMDLKKPLKTGELVPITLTVEAKSGKKERIEVKAEVRDLTAGAPQGMKHGEH
ncbi:MAG TPA: copper chaperone PCu(A)C [Rhodocyclaceae bacterium]